MLTHSRSFFFFFLFSDPPHSPLPTSSYNSIIQMSIQNTHLCLFPRRLHGNKPVPSISGGRLTHTFPSALRPSHLPAVCRSGEERQRERKIVPQKNNRINSGCKPTRTSSKPLESSRRRPAALLHYTLCVRPQLV